MSELQPIVYAAKMRVLGDSIRTLTKMRAILDTHDLVEVPTNCFEYDPITNQPRVCLIGAMLLATGQIGQLWDATQTRVQVRNLLYRNMFDIYHNETFLTIALRGKSAFKHIINAAVHEAAILVHNYKEMVDAKEKKGLDHA